MLPWQSLIFLNFYLESLLTSSAAVSPLYSVDSSVCAVCLGLSSLAKNIVILFLTYSVLYALGTSYVLSASLNIITRYFKRWRSMATGILACGQGGGILIQGPLLQAIIDAFGWRTVFQIMAGVVPVLCPSGPTYSPNLQNSDPESPPEKRRVKDAILMLQCGRNPNLWRLLFHKLSYCLVTLWRKFTL